jgi:hypothetical protein
VNPAPLVFLASVSIPKTMPKRVIIAPMLIARTVRALLNTIKHTPSSLIFSV